ncbi:hypothetical protein [Plesiomonas shigelloides]|uniref:Uncharacterized protein n=1 Tax=Plesiomonas shigelloides 302-73 TaxID=1315976 RepID=R8AM04_PLESH|nr:hypothetical protein [Plesiomonas shigelloides]EON87376.1 hypothetical protein PLESHI_16044 [Plesiomonas shigelloides 302-73]
MLNNPEQILHQIQHHLWQTLNQATTVDDFILRQPRQQRSPRRALFSLPQGFHSRSQRFRPYVEELLYELDGLKMQSDSPLIDVHISTLAHKLELLRSELRCQLRGIQQAS